MAAPFRLWHAEPMQRPNTKAGGCFLTLSILAGFGAGLALGDPLKGVVVGTGIGAALALLLWLVDRRRAG